jgi:hypothetical protein
MVSSVLYGVPKSREPKGFKEAGVKVILLEGRIIILSSFISSLSAAVFSKGAPFFLQSIP